MKWKNPLIRLGWIACLFLSINPLNAQPYKSLFSKGDYTTRWTTTWFNLNIAGIVEAYVQKDTLVHGLVYKKVILTGLEDWGYLFREDTVQGLVWTRSASMEIPPYGGPPGWAPDTTDRLAFRFDLKEGDSFDISNVQMHKGTYPDSLNIVDSVRIVDGRRHIYFRARVTPGISESPKYKEPLTLIEGVGSNMGILWKWSSDPLRGWRPGAIPFIGAYLLCHYKDGQQTSFRNKRYDGECFPDLHIPESGPLVDKDLKVTLYPQPARDRVWIRGPEGMVIHSIQIYSPMGQLIQHLKGVDLKDFETKNLLSGLYYIRLFSNHNHPIVTSLVIQ